MTSGQRIRNILIGLSTIVYAAILVFLGYRFEEGAIALILFVIGLTLTVRGIKAVRFYFTMARHMVNGMNSLLAGVVLLDFGMITLSMDGIHISYIILYLLGAHVFYGAADILQGIESRRNGNSSWKLSIVYGAGNLAMAFAALMLGYMTNRIDIVIYIYAAGILYSGAVRIINSMRRTAIVYIQ